MGRREIHLTDYIFLRRLNYPSLISSPPSPPPPKLKHKLHNSNKLTENNTQPPNKVLQKFSLKKKILLQKLQLIQISDVTRTNPELINKKKKNYDLNIFLKEIDMGLNSCESWRRNRSKLNNYLLPTIGVALKWVCRLGLVHDRVFLEAIPISCLSSL